MTPEEQAAADQAEADRIAAEAAQAAADAANEAEIERRANERAATIDAERVAAAARQTTNTVLDPYEQAARDLEASGIPDYAPNYEQSLRSRALAIQGDRTKAEILASVGEIVIPMRNDRAVATIIPDGDKLKREFATKWVGKINQNDPEQVELLQLAAERYAEKNTKATSSVSSEKADTPAPEVMVGAKAEAARLASVGGNAAYALTDAEIAEALREAA